MFQFHILGRIELLGNRQTRVRSVLAQPKRVALLAYLATARGEAVSRERIAEVFWPGADRERAQHSVSQAVYALRRSLGRELVVSDELGRLSLDQACITSDFAQFHRAVERGALQEALMLWRGELLEGLPLHDLPPFERWLDEEREKLRGVAKAAALQMVEQSERRGDVDAAVGWARRARELAPYEEVPLRRLLLLLHSRGDRGQAIAEYERFEAVLREDLEVEPSGRTRELIANLTADGGVPVETVPIPLPLPSTGAIETERLIEPAPVPPAPPRQRGPLRPAGPLRWRVPAAGLLGLLLLVILVVVPARPESVRGTDPSRIAVFPFAFHGNAQYDYLGEGVAELLRLTISGMEHIGTVDPRGPLPAQATAGSAGPSPAEAEALAREHGADLFVLGSVLEAGGRLQITASLHQIGSGAITSHQGRADGESGLFELVDELVRSFMASEGLPRSTHLLRTAASTTHSLPALKQFLRGEQDFRRGRYRDSYQAFAEAARLDGSFALAHYRAAMTLIWTGPEDFDLARRWADRAVEHEERLPESHRILVHALRAFLQGTGPVAERLYRDALEVHPGNAEGWFNLGEVLFHYGPLMGRSSATSRSAWERVTGFDPDLQAGLVHLAAIAALEGRWTELEELVVRLEQLHPGEPLSPHIETLAAWTFGGAERRRDLLARLETESVGRIRQTISYAGRYLQDLEAGIRIASVLTSPERSVSERAEGHLWLAHFKLAGGRRLEAIADLERAERYDPVLVHPFRLMLATMPEVPLELRTLDGRGWAGVPGDPQASARVVDAGPRIPLPPGGDPRWAEGGPIPFPLLHPYLQALSHPPSAHIPSVLRAAADETDRRAGTSNDGTLGILLAEALRAEAELLEGRPEAARDRLVAGLDQVELWYEMLRVSPIYALARERYRLADLLAADGRLEDAIHWFHALTQSSPGEIVYVGPVHLRIAELKEQLGQPDEARGHYQYVLDLWSGADPEFEPVRAEIRARLQTLGAGPARAAHRRSGRGSQPDE